MKLSVIFFLALAQVATSAEVFTDSDAEIDDLLQALQSPSAGHATVESLQAALLGFLVTGHHGNRAKLSSFISQIQTMMNNTLIPQLLSNFSTMQSNLQPAYNLFAACNANSTALNSSLTVLASQVASFSIQHMTCRTQQSALAASVVSCTSALPGCSSLNQLNQQLTNTSLTSSACTPTTSDDLNAFATRMAAYWTSEAARWTNFQTLCSSSPQCQGPQNQLNQQQQACNAIQNQMDATSCQLAQVSQAGCNSINSCYQTAVCNYTSAMSAAKNGVVSLQSQYEAMLRLSCIANAFANGPFASLSVVNQCTTANYSSQLASLTLTVNPIPPTPTCYPSNDTAGTKAYVKANYVILPANAPAGKCNATCC